MVNISKIVKKSVYQKKYLLFRLIYWHVFIYFKKIFNVLFFYRKPFTCNLGLEVKRMNSLKLKFLIEDLWITVAKKKKEEITKMHRIYRKAFEVSCKLTIIKHINFNFLHFIQLFNFRLPTFFSIPKYKSLCQKKHI